MDWIESATEYLEDWKARNAAWRSKFTSGALKCLSLARDEAVRLHRDYVGAEHLLLGLTNLSPDSPDHLLRVVGLDIDKIRLEAGRLAGAGVPTVEHLQTPYTPRAKRVIENARKDADCLGRRKVGPGQLFSALLLESEGRTAQIFDCLKLDRTDLRAKSLAAMKGDGMPRPPAAETQ
jgi:ATP-dependent Clp protease ATP-binding subunit ClpC